MRFASVRLAAFAFACGTTTIATAGATAQVPSAASLAPASSAVSRALASPGSGIEILRNYVANPAAGRPAEISRRAREVLLEIERMRGRIDFGDLAGLVTKVTDAAVQSLTRGHILRVGIDAGFRPKHALYALDFGAADREPAPGFERAGPTDPRIGGAAIAPADDRGQNGMIADGLTAIERIELDAPPGLYRVLLFTRRDDRGTRRPLGRQIKINGVPYAIAESDPDGQAPETFLTAGDENWRRPEAKVESGIVIRALSAAERRAADTFRGGVLITESESIEGKIIVEIPRSAAKTFLSGAIVERADAISNLVLAPNAASVLITLDERLQLQAEILAVAARTLAAAIPASGPASDASPDIVIPPLPLALPDGQVESPN